MSAERPGAAPSHTRARRRAGKAALALAAAASLLLGAGLRQITKRRRAPAGEPDERRVRSESMRELMAIADLAPNIVWSKPAVGRIDYLNPRFFDFTGAPPSPAVAVPWEDYLHPDDLEAVLSAQARAEVGEIVREIQFRLRDAAGAYRTMISRLVVLRDPRSGEAMRLVGTLTDIQDFVESREATAAALAVAEGHKAHLRLILDSVPDAMIVTDEEGVIQSFSAAAEAMFGWTATEVIGQNVRLLMPEPFRSGHDGYMSRHVATGEVHLLAGRVLVGQRRDGSTFPFEMSLGSLRSDEGRFFTSFLRDLSERRATEQRLQGLQTELAHVSRLSAMGEMAAGMAHELNQPLMAAASYIQGSSRLLRREAPPLEEIAGALEAASREVLRAGDIIRRIRGFVSQGAVERQPEVLEPLLREAAALAMIGAQDLVSTRYRIARDLPPALVDRVQVQQVVVNLVRNAVEAMAQSPRRELTLSAALAGEGMIEVSVADTGPGLDSKVAAELFRPFVTTKASGMGLGLSVSRTIVEAHGGRIWARRRPGGGTIFRFTVPAAPVQGGEDAPVG